VTICARATSLELSARAIAFRPNAFDETSIGSP
jgi:hypothetical protein